MAVLVKGSTLTATDWGIESEAESLVTQRVSTTQRVDKKEAIKHDGEVGAVCFYNKSTEVTIEGLGVSARALAGSITSIGGLPTAGGTLYCTEVTVDLANEEFAKSSIKGRAWALM